MKPLDPHATVAIVGFGPVGAVLAGLLGRRGLHVLVFDRESDVYQLPRAAHIDHTGLRTLQELGCAGSLLPTMIGNPGMDFVAADRSLLFRIPASRPARSGFPASMYFHPPTLDRTLRQTAAALPSVDVRLDTEVRSVAADAEGVTLRVAPRGAPSGVEEEVRVGWVVGCDGAASGVREAAGIGRASFGFDKRWLIFDLRLRDPRPALPERAVQVCDPDRPHTQLPMPGDRFRFEFMLLEGEEESELLRPEVARQRLLAPLVPLESVEIERTAVYTFSGLVARPWREGRILLAGDAAHQMPPFLGQGMCSGIRDAANLAWKLERVLRAGATDALLDTYESERRPHVAHIIGAAVDVGRVICTTDPGEAAARDRRLLNDPRPPDQRFQFALPSLEPGPLVLDGGGALFIQPPIGTEHGRLDDVVGPRFLVLGSSPEVLAGSADWWERQAGALVTTADELTGAATQLKDWLARRGATFVVVRPDRYVLATGTDLDAVTAAVCPWLEAGESLSKS